MRKRTGALFLLLSLVWLPGAAAADAIAANQIEVNAVVAPARYIIVDTTDQISEIISNCDQNVTPTVYLSSVKTANQQPLSASLFARYQVLMAGLRSSHIGVLYQARPRPRHQAVSKPKPLGLMASLLSLPARPLKASVISYFD